MTGVRERIRQHRFASVTLRVARPDGRPLADAAISVEQTAHAFLFGQTGGHILPFLRQLRGWNEEQVAVFKERAREIHNIVTLPFYWGRFEPEEGKPHTESIKEAAVWYKANGFMVKGHPLCWHTVTADWLMRYPNADILQKQRDRVRREVAAFAGCVDVWDVVNEPVIMPHFDKYDNGITRIAKEYGVDKLVETLFRDAREANPRAVLVLNEYILNKHYEGLIAKLLKRGTPIDVIGLQTHQHQGYRGAETVWDYAERFGRLGLPLHFTENTIISGECMPAHFDDLNDFKQPDWPSTPEGEERQAAQAAEFYSLLYSHPAVQSLCWWDLVDGGWLNAPGGLLRRDLSPKPAFHAVRNLIKGEWWTGRRELKTDERGEARLEAALGTYRLTAADSEARFQVEKTVPNIDIRFQ